MRRFRKAHPERTRASLAAWLADHPTYERDRSRRRYATDPEYRRRVRASARQFRVDHPEYYRAAAKVRRARMAGVKCTLSEEETRELFDEYEGRCAYCGDPATTIDHVVPISKGGAHSKENVVPACKPCNSSKNAKPLLVWLATRRGRTTCLKEPESQTRRRSAPGTCSDT
jgi:5-methylcytosine-specific restriction endonuclease McrA